MTGEAGGLGPGAGQGASVAVTLGWQAPVNPAPASAVAGGAGKEARRVLDQQFVVPVDVGEGVTGGAMIRAAGGSHHLDLWVNTAALTVQDNGQQEHPGAAE